MEDYPSLAEGNGLENRQVGQTTQEFESLILLFIIAGWSSLVARRAHNPKVVGSNPAPATINPLISIEIKGFFCAYFSFLRPLPAVFPLNISCNVLLLGGSNRQTEKSGGEKRGVGNEKARCVLLQS